MREVHIQPVLNGFIVKVGCETVVFRDIDILCMELRRYQKNPAEVEKEYQRVALNPINTAVPERERPAGVEARQADEGQADEGGLTNIARATTRVR